MNLKTKDLYKFIFIHFTFLGLGTFFFGCDWADPVLKSLRNCTLPTDIIITADTADPRKYTFSIATTIPTDVKTVVWKVLNGTTVLVQSTLTASQAYAYTASANGNYTVSAEIETFCGEKKTLTKTLPVKTCIQPSAINTLSISNTTYSFGLVTTVPADVKSVSWKVLNGSNTISQEQRNDASSFNYTFNLSGSYTISADIVTACGENLNRTLVVTVTIAGVSSASNFKAWRNGGVANDVGNGVAVDGLGNVYVVGNYGSSIAFGATTLNVVGSNDVFIAKYNSNGD